MKKIKVTANERVLVFDFFTDLLKENRLFRICEIAELSEIYVDLFNVHKAKKDFTSKLADNNIAPLEYKIEKSNVHIKIMLCDLPQVLDILSEFDFDDLNIWNVYTNWDQYLKDKAIYKVVPLSQLPKSLDNEFYLNYKPSEGNKVEAYFNPKCNPDRVLDKLKEII